MALAVKIEKPMTSPENPLSLAACNGTWVSKMNSFTFFTELEKSVLTLNFEGMRNRVIHKISHQVATLQIM